MVTPVVLHRDPRCRGSLGGRYFYTSPDGTEWEVNGTRHSTGYVYTIGRRLDVLDPDVLGRLLEVATQAASLGVTVSWE